MDNSEINKIYNKYFSLSDQAWRSALVKSVSTPLIDDIQFPLFPSTELQRHLQGNSNEIAIRGALAFREHCVRVLHANQKPFSSASILIDFGTGWGRIARAFMKDLPAANIFAVEPFDFILEARKANSYISFVKSDPRPPLPFRDGFATHIVTWSTFSHFNKEYFDSWIIELARVLRAGGICFITTLGVKFLEDLKAAHLRKLANEEVHFWIELILRRLPYPEIDNVIAEIKSGKFVWLPSDAVARSEFAECFVTDKYLSSNFSDMFEVIDYSCEGQLAQDCIALRKR
ncbi:class I SAM-dependent methyltransferase [Bradyrhizobium symbiodeficiens]|uniref:class I SAM-dependent methyltransferase n=1 Tax=Bradyrhizobium symbiodeficiens TaxID=1404367 RepID=UPI00140F512F|nr:class I SAM-dependent methyltransferase [Bradyrhizobium symbiodeficiens]QIO98811.1 class I SAM-dependent methyltransferase [Bradyrhizobium symbiodeficiens]